MDERDLQKLLRLKRYEQPPPEYFDGFLREFQRRQRSEIIREPLWKIALDRVGGFFTDHAPYRTAYGTAAFAVLTLAGLASGVFFAPTPEQPPQVASLSTPRPADPETITLDDSLFDPATSTVSVNFPSQPAISQPHYVIDARPVSYERPFRF